MARIARSIILGHRPNTGEDTRQIEFAADDEVSVLAEWQSTYLCRDAEGRLFHIPKDCVELD